MQKRAKISPLLIIGILIFLVGSGPLIATMILAKVGFLADPNPNPVVFGIMAYFTFWPSIILMAVGLSKTLKERKSI